MTAEPTPNLSDTPSPKTLLVLGSTGKLGRLMRASVDMSPGLMSGWRIVWGGRRACEGVDWIYSECTPPKADAVLALWGVVPGQGELSDNITLALRAMEIAKECGAARVLHCSSSAVYGPVREASENTALTPLNAYGIAKIEMEQSLFSAAIQYPQQPAHCVMRLANVVGGDSLFGAINSGHSVTLDAIRIGHSPIRSYATPSILWQAVATLLKADTLPDLVNVAASNPVAMHELLEAANHSFVWRPAPETAVAEVSLSVARLRRLTGQTLVIPPEDMIAEWRKLLKAAE